MKRSKKGEALVSLVSSLLFRNSGDCSIHTYLNPLGWFHSGIYPSIDPSEDPESNEVQNINPDGRFSSFALF